jgi:hypothetical protein
MRGGGIPLRMTPFWEDSAMTPPTKKRPRHPLEDMRD